MPTDRILSLHPCAAVWCAGEYVELGAAGCPDCCEIAAASVRAATQAPDPVPVERDGVSPNLRAGSVSALSARLFGDAPVAACTARPALSVSHMDNAQGPSCVPLPKLRQVSR